MIINMKKYNYSSVYPRRDIIESQVNHFRRMEKLFDDYYIDNRSYYGELEITIRSKFRSYNKIITNGLKNRKKIASNYGLIFHKQLKYNPYDRTYDIKCNYPMNEGIFR